MPSRAAAQISARQAIAERHDRAQTSSRRCECDRTEHQPSKEYYLTPHLRGLTIPL